jgi:hypothetical protein
VYVIKGSTTCINTCPSNYVIYNYNQDNIQYICVNPFCEAGEKFDESAKVCNTKASGTKYIYKQVGDDNKKYTYVWVTDCIGVQNYIKDENDPECVSSCPTGNDYIYDNESNKNIKCLKKCTTNYYLDIPGKPGKYQCWNNCSLIILVDSVTNTKICSRTENPNFKYKRDDSNKRYRSCPSENIYYLKEEGDYIKCKGSTNPCAAGRYYFEGECLDAQGCYGKNQIYLDKDDKTCSDKCKTEKKFKKKDDTTNAYICLKNCDLEMFIDSGNYCVKPCPKDKNFIGKDNYCKSQCDKGETNEQYYYYNGTIGTGTSAYNIYRCTKECKENGYIYKGYNTSECFTSCSGSLQYTSANEKKCYSNCLQSTTNSFTKGSKCVNECDSTKPFYYESNKICLDTKCQNGDYAYSTDGNKTYECIRDCSSTTSHKFFYEADNSQSFNICVQECWGEKPFYNGRYCMKQCPEDKKFFIKPPNINKLKNIQCLTDCPKTHKYFKIDDEYGRTNLYECSNIQYSSLFIDFNEIDKKVNATLCVDACPPKSMPKNNTLYSKYQFKYKNKCYINCPNNVAFHDYDEYDCKTSCNTTTKQYHEINSTICISEKDCIGNYIDYENKTCYSKDLDLTGCPPHKTLTTKPKNLGKTICSYSCSYSYFNGNTETKYHLRSPYNTCVNQCTDISPYMKNLKNEDFNSDCFCVGLFYINTTEQVACLPNTDSDSKCKMHDTTYRINYDGTNECIQTCNDDRVLSLKEDYCYDTYQCDGTGDENTQKIEKSNGIKQCDCMYRFYYEQDSDNPLDKKIVKKCLDNGVRCHDENMNRYAPETLECKNDTCPDELNYEFQNYFCLRDCPKDSTPEGKKCICKSPYKFWHRISSTIFECLEKCHDQYPVYAPDNNRCLPKCKGSYFPVFYDYKCFRNCSNRAELNIYNAIHEPNVINQDLYNQTCKCTTNTTWYKNESNTIICSYNLTDCRHFTDPVPKNFRYLIYETYQCVDECPDDYPYIFNEGCFKNCAQAATIYPWASSEGIFECQCENLWYNETRKEDNFTYKVCIDPEIKECYIDSTTRIYRINKTNECVEKCPDEMFIFNYICYEKCPNYTQDNVDNKTCLCNTNMGYWYQYDKNMYKNIFNLLECGVDECPNDISDKSGETKPDTRQYLYKEQKKCVKNCSTITDFSYNYKNICIKECPYYTNNLSNQTCDLFELNDAKIHNREELKAATAVQALELYYNETKTKNPNKDEFFFDRYNTSIHIYGIDRNNSYKDKVNFKSDPYNNLTYIDFGTCINKLFLDKNISEDEQILVTKYDIYNETTNMINRVEYELFSDKTNEKLDALVCDPYEILISYPLFLERFDNYEGTDNLNEYSIKFVIGKALYEEDNTVNTFDYNNYIYKNFCRGLEYDGKDLVYEDRYKNLYPNKMLLCENNCTINNTDFENKRINCLCIYKTEIDFDREENVDDIFNNPNYYIPTQSSANAEAIKCLFNFTVQQTVTKNFAFAYCFIIAAIEIALGVISSIIGINPITNYVKPILNKIQNKDFKKKSKPKKSIGFKTDNVITTTNRPLNNPPRRNNIEDDDDEIDNEDAKNNNNATLSDNDIDSMENRDRNYEINIKKSNNNMPRNNNKYKAEYIPQQYNTKFFKPTDKGVIKKIDRSKLPFKINKDTKYLVEKKVDIEYEANYLDGYYSPSQNILIITDGSNTDITNIVKYIKNEKFMDGKAKNDIKPEDKKLLGNLDTNTKYTKYNDKDLITVKKLKSNLVKPNVEEDSISDIFDEDSDDMKVNEDNAGLFTLIRREQLFLRLDYKKYLEKKHPNNLAIFIAEILDKMYIIKIILFLKKYDIFTHQLSLYLFCHVLLMSLLCGFFTIRVIKKIWNETGYPGIGFYLLYGLVSNIIIWIIYQIFLYIIDFKDKLKEIVLLQKELKNQETYDFDDNIDERNEKIFNKKYSQIIKHIHCTIIVFYIIIYIIISFCAIYLISFFALYTGTRSRVIKAYIYSLIEIVIIKFVYGFSLASLRTASRINKMKKVYKVVYIFDKYIS